MTNNMDLYFSFLLVIICFPPEFWGYYDNLFNFQSYASILYLRVPPSFRIILRGKDVEHHNIVNDMMMTQEVTYRPQTGADGVPKDINVMFPKLVCF